MLWLSIVNQPASKPLSRDVVLQGHIPYGLSIKLQGAYDKVNGFEPEEQRFLSSPSDENNLTPDSQSSSSAKNSDGPNSSITGQAEKPSSNSPVILRTLDDMAAEEAEAAKKEVPKTRP